MAINISGIHRWTHRHTHRQTHRQEALEAAVCSLYHIGPTRLRHFFQIIFFTGIFILLSQHLSAQRSQNKENLVYKQNDSLSLSMKFYYPEELDTAPRPALIFFFGGGWKKSDLQQFEQHAQYFAIRGLVSILAEYRVENIHGTTPFDALKDANSAIRFLRENAHSLNIAPDRIAAAGGSAGGQLAAATALTSGYEEAGENLSVSPRPDALILFNPVIDNGPGGYGFERIKEQYHQFSPLHNIKEGAPPTIIFLGTEDKYVPVETAQYYKLVMERIGSRCDLHLYQGQKHGFFNYTNKEYFQDTLHKADKFLISLGFLTGEPK